MGKPITLPEWGLDPTPSSNNGGFVSDPGTEVGGGDDPVFINDMAQWISQHNVFDATYWDYGWSLLSLTSNPQSEAAFINDFGGVPTSTAPPAGGSASTGAAGNGSPSGETASSVTIMPQPSPVVTAEKARFQAQIQTEPSGEAGPVGDVSWSVTSRTGTPVSCSSGNNVSNSRNGMTQCAVPAGMLSAGAGPYTISVRYKGADGVAPSAASLTQPVARASSTVRTASNALPSNEVEVVATVNTGTTGSNPPTGTVGFTLSVSSGNPPVCLGGNTVSVVSGQATCVLAGNVTARGLYYVSASYSGDSNFGPSVSRSQRVALPPGVVAAPS
jgi:hypothetical protein